MRIHEHMWRAVVMTTVLVVGQLCGQVQGEVYDESCRFALASQVTQVATSDIAELHIRQNIQGSLEIRDGDLDETNLRLYIEKSAPTEDDLQLIVVNQSSFQVALGRIHLIQIDYVQKKSHMVNVVVGVVITSSLVLLLLCVIGCWYWKHRHDYSPDEILYTQAITPGLERNITADTVVPEEEGEGQGHPNKHCSSGTIRGNGQLPQHSCHLGESGQSHDPVVWSGQPADCGCGQSTDHTSSSYTRLDDQEEHLPPLQTSSPRTDPPASFPACCYDNSVISPSSTLTDTDLNSGNNTLNRLSMGSSNTNTLNRLSLGSSNNNSYELLDRRNVRGAQNNRGSPKPISRTTVAMVTVVTMVSLVYASCPTRPGVNLVLLIPPPIKLGGLKVFYNQEHNNEVITDTWMLRNFTNFQVFDIPDVSLTTDPPCTPADVCPTVSPTTRIGCDATSRECVCHRGYQLTDGACIDEDECTAKSHRCPTSATCVNTMGGYLCQCAEGYYATRDECRVCSAGCEADHYEAKPCTNLRDRICKPCQTCQGSMYEVRPCTPSSDRECIHAAHPLLISSDESTPTFLEELRVDASDNLILEDLHNTRDLETTFYVTDTTQASDFKWARDSGLVVKIGILNVHLIAEYEDVDHESDNTYMLSNPNESQDKHKFKEVMDTKCRNPVPDYYSITMEISRDRMTAAKMTTCDNRNPSLDDCPVGKIDGSTYLERMLNEPCTKMGTFPEPLHTDTNSIVCTDNTDLLREVYNHSYTAERPITFPSKKCKTAQMRCEQCVSHLNCQYKELFESKCCLVDCYTLPDCKLSLSSECIGAPVECAMGDAYRYTIQPVFQKIKDEFHCHIEHKPSELLYELFFYLEMPGTDFITPRVDKTVYAKDLNYASQGEFEADYLTVEHNSGVSLDKEFMLIGREDQASETEETHRGDNMNYTLHPLKTAEDFQHNRRVSVHEIDHNIYVATTEFSRPFDYSTSSWVRNNECHKDISKFKYYNKEKSYTDPRQNVNLRVQPGPEKYKYWIQGERSPYIRCTVPGNMSILPWYFKDNGPELLTDSSLNLTLQLLGDKVWNIHISGQMSNCPAYLGVTINDRENMEELIKHDILVTCPSSFNLTFHIPNFLQPHDKTFDIHLKDAKKVYQTFVTQVKLDEGSQLTEPEPVVLTEAEEVPYITFLIIIALTLLTAAVFNKAYIYGEIMRQKNRGQFIAKQQGGGGHHGDSTPRTHSATCGRSLSSGQVVFLVVYIILRVIYSLLFTFTVFFAILMIFIKSDLENLSRVDDFVQEAKNQSLQMSQDNDRHWRVELLRQAVQVKDMQGACSNYVTELFDSMAFQMNNITSNYYTHELYGSNASLSYLMHQRSKVQLQDLSENIQEFSKTYKDHVQTQIIPAIHKYKQFLRVIFTDDWLSFSQKMFNASDAWRGQNDLDLYLSRDLLLLSGIETEFVRFLEIEEVDDLRLWSLRFWERYESLLPEIPELPIPEIGPNKLFCETLSHHGNYNISRQPSLRHMDSVQYFAPLLPADVDRGPVYHNGYEEEEYRFVTERPLVKAQPSPRADEELDITQMINTQLLSMVFLILDAILLLYRFSHTFINASTIVKGFDVEASKEEWEAVEYYTQTIRAHTLPAVGGGKHKYKHTPDHSHVPLGEQNYEVSYQGKVVPSYNGNGDAISTLKSPSCHRDKYYYSRKSRTDFIEAIVNNIRKITLSNTLPQVLIGCCLLVLVYVVTLLLLQVADMKFILHTNLLAMYTSGMHVQINQTNWYLTDQATYFNQVSMNIYQGQMMSELKYLQSMLHYFDNEQVRLVDNYHQEGCSITRQSAANWSCDLQVEPPALQLPLLPCNFVPIIPKLLSELLPVTLEQKLVKTLDPYMVSVRHVSRLLTYIVFVALAAIFIIHVCGVVVFHFLKSSHKFTVRRVYMTADLPPTSGDEFPPPPPTEESDYESGGEETTDGGGSHVWSYSLPKATRERYSTNTYPSPARGRPKPEATGTLLNDFKYSETKV